MKRRALSTVVGTVFAIISLTSSITYVTYSMGILDNYNQSVLTRNQQMIDVNKESFQVTGAEIDNNKFNITVRNTGNLPINFTKIWIQNTTDTDWVRSYIPSNNVVSTGSTLANIGQNIPLYARTDQSYQIKLVTSKGNTQGFNINSVNNGPIQLQLFTTPSVVPVGFTTNIILAVTNNMSNNAIMTNVIPTLKIISGGASPSCSSTSTPQSYKTIPNGGTGFFQWTCTMSGSIGSSSEFNATILNAYKGNFVLSTVNVSQVPSAAQSETSLTAQGLSALNIDDSQLVFHQETLDALNGYQMYSASADTTGKILQMDTAGTQNFYTNNDTTVIHIPAGNWNAMLRYLSSPVATTLPTNNNMMIYHFEDGLVATTALDSTGNANTLTLGTGASKPTCNSVNGVHGSGGCSFNGAQFMNSNIKPGVNDIGSADTTSGWFKTSSTARQVILRMGSNTDSSPFYEIGLDNGANTGKLLFRYAGNSNITPISCETSSPYNDGNWHHFIATRSYAGNIDTCKLYVDGVQKVTNNGVSCNGCGNHAAGTWTVGRDDSSGGKNYFTGNLDDIIHWNSVTLNTGPPNQITDLYQSNYGTSGHMLNFVINIVDQNGNLVNNLITNSNYPMNFADSFGAYSNPSNTSWNQYNYSASLPAVTLQSNQRLQLQMTFVSQVNNGQLNMKLDIDNSGISGKSNANSLLQIPKPDVPLIGYYKYDHTQNGNVYVYNPGPYSAWLTYNTRITFETLDQSQAYGSWVCGFGGDSDTNKDSPIVTAGATLSVCFSRPALTPAQNPDGGNNNIITTGRYRMYAFLSGYDQKGETFFVTQYIGPVRVT